MGEGFGGGEWVMSKDPYEVLGVERDADAKEIKKRTGKLAAKYHPDQNLTTQAPRSASKGRRCLRGDRRSRAARSLRSIWAHR